MGATIIARNYAETLLALAERNGGTAVVDEFGRAIDEVADLLRHEPRVRDFLRTPRVSVESKQEAMRASFSGRVPELFLRFLLVVLAKRRQGILPQVAEEYHALVDAARGRVRAEIRVARPADEALQREIVAVLERQLGKTVVPRFTVDPELIGGLVVRVGDQVFDGSLRRRMASLRRQLLGAALPEAAPA